MNVGNLLDQVSYFMNVESLIDSINQRFPYQILQASLKMCDLPRGQGKVKTLAKLSEHFKTTDSLDKFEEMKKIYEQHLLVGEKTLKIFKISQEDKEYISSKIASLQEDKTKFKGKYPFFLDKDEIHEVDFEPHLTHIEKDEAFTYCVFCTKRFFTEKVVIDKAEIKSIEFRKDDREEIWESCDEIAVVHRYTRQFFDVVAIPKTSDFVEVRIDMGLGILVDDKKRAFHQIEGCFNNLVRNSSGQDFLSNPIELFNLVGSLYSSHEGKVRELGFTTDEGSIKHSKMRKNSDDLREEAFHKAGKNAVDGITPFRLSIAWEYSLMPDKTIYPELTLPGTHAMLQKSHRDNSEEVYLADCMIENCIGTDSYNLVFTKMVEYLSDSNEQAKDY